jgi:glycosyltransferase involved in cell wall biosynthesis
MLFIGSSLKSGIGQHANKYTKIFPDASYFTIGSKIPEDEYGLIFLLPLREHIEYAKYAKTRVKHLACMTVCETTTVHEDYGMIMEEFDRVAVPSEFCKSVLSRQFPKNDFYVIHAHIPKPREKPYVFYHIGNIMDDRKNFKQILQAFVRLNEPNTRLVVKATCNQDVDIRLPRVEVINNMLDSHEMDDLHRRCDCYVNFSKSEGVGMGAIEAAIRDKPVILTDFGGPSEYIKSPYMINCELQELENDDFLFQKGMIWGKPNFDQLLEFMKHAYENKVYTMDHIFTKQVVNRENVLREFFVNVIGDENDDTGEEST